jgi:hypothetical protein
MGPDILTQAEATYLQSTWYNQDPTTGWWWQAQPIYPILRQGLFKAIREAGTLPIDSYWLPVTTGNLVAVLVAVSERQATRIIITPPSPYLDKQSRSPARIWEIKRGHDGFPADEDKEPALLLADDVVTPDTTVNVWRRKERPYP